MTTHREHLDWLGVVGARARHRRNSVCWARTRGVRWDDGRVWGGVRCRARRRGVRREGSRVRGGVRRRARRRIRGAGLAALALLARVVGAGRACGTGDVRVPSAACDRAADITATHCVGARPVRAGHAVSVVDQAHPPAAVAAPAGHWAHLFDERAEQRRHGGAVECVK